MEVMYGSPYRYFKILNKLKKLHTHLNISDFYDIKLKKTACVCACVCVCWLQNLLQRLLTSNLIAILIKLYLKSLGLTLRAVLSTS